MSVTIQFSAYLNPQGWIRQSSPYPLQFSVTISKIKVQYLDSTKTSILDEYDTGWVSSGDMYTDDFTWKHKTNTRTPPAGTRYARIFLIGSTFTVLGTGDSPCVMMYDNISLKVNSTISGLSSELVVNGSFESVFSAGWGNEHGSTTSEFPAGTDLSGSPDSYFQRWAGDGTFHPQAGSYLCKTVPVGYSRLWAQNDTDIDLSSWASEIDPPAPTPPDAVDDSATVLVTDITKTIAVLANDTYTGTPTVTILSGPSLTGASATVNGSNEIVYTKGAAGIDTITYQLDDDNGSDTATVTITVNGATPPLPTPGSGSIGMQIHPYNLLRDPNTTLSATTLAAGYSVANLRDTRTSRKIRSTTTTLVIDGDSSTVKSGFRHADALIFPPGHNLLPSDTVQIETHNGGASVYDQTFTIPENPDTDPAIWGEAGILLSTYGCLAFLFGQDAMASTTQWRVTITTNSPNTYVEIPPFYFGWSFQMDRNYFYGWGDGFAGLQLAASEQVRHVLTLTFGAATDNDWRKVAMLNRELGIAMPFYISLEPEASAAATAKDGLRQHRLTFYGYLAQLVQVQNRPVNINSLTIVFKAQQ